MAASCPSTYSWANNRGGKDPCAVASALKDRCDNGRSEPYRPLPPGYSYAQPDKRSANDCVCSSVLYAVVSACADCQGRPYFSWSHWARECDRVFESSFPRSVSQGFQPSQWAFFNTSVQQSYNPELARAIAQPPASPTQAPTSPQISVEPTIQPLPTSLTDPTDTTQSLPTVSTSTKPTGVSVAPTAANFTTETSPQLTRVLGYSADDDSAPTATATDTDQLNDDGTQPTALAASSSGSRTGPIVGAAIGAILILAFIVGALFYWRVRRRRARIAPSAAYMAAYGTARPATSMSSRPFTERIGRESPFYTPSNSDYNDEPMRESVRHTHYSAR